MNDRVLRNLLTVNLAVRPHEDVLILADVRPGHPRPVTALAARTVEAARRVARLRYALYPETGRNGVEPPRSAWLAAFGGAAVDELERESLLEPLLAKQATPRQIRRATGIVIKYRAAAPRAAVFMTAFSATHTKFRGLLNAAGARVASMPGIEASMFNTALAINQRRMATLTERVARRMNAAHAVRIVNPDGTDLRFSIRGRRSVPDTGFIKPGRFGNLPAGEAFVAPVEETGEGMLVARHGPECHFPRGIRFTIRRSRVVRVDGGGAIGRTLAGLFRAHPEFSVIAEFGVGTNPGATTRTNILESEKILGTIHIAFGDNATFGGRNRAAFHQDFLVFQPTVTLTGRGAYTLLERGRLRA
jgi:leucyl aminopeptidase (aminopeptidase T)